MPTTAKIDPEAIVRDTIRRIGYKKLARIVRDHFPLTPRGIIDHLDLRRPTYQATAALGHLGSESKVGLFT